MNKFILNKQTNVRKGLSFLCVLLFLLCSNVAYSQSITVSGTVTDVNGDPLTGVSVAVKGTTTGTITDIDGKFSLQASAQTVLVFSYVGFLTQEITVGNQRNMNIRLIEDTRLIEEVVVIGYGTVRKSDVTGSVISVNTEEMLARNPLNIVQGLQGAASGVNVYRNSGDPSGAETIRIRGIGTINNSTSPLYVVDGIAVGTSVSFLNPNDVDRIEVLKDAASTAIYGAQGSNGVILISTKRGQRGVARVNFSTTYQVITPNRLFNVLDAYDFVHMARETAQNDGTSLSNPAWSAYDRELNSINWQKEMTRTALYQTYNLNVTGGSDNMRSVFSMGYVNNDGGVINSNFKRFTARANIDATVKNIIKLGININYNYDQSVGGGQRNAVTHSAQIPTMDQVDSDGKLINVPIRWDKESDNPWGTGIWGHYLREGTGNTNRSHDNLVAAATIAESHSGNARILVAPYVEIDILKNLTFRTNGALRYNNNFSNSYSAYNPRTFDGMSGFDQFSVSGGNNKTLTISSYLTYILNINDIHRLNLMAGWEASRYDGQSQNASVRDFPFPTLRQINLGNQTTLSAGGGLNRESRDESMFGRANYSLKDRYTFQATVRREGSSSFGPGNRYGVFPSVSGVWRISEELFMKSQPIFSMLNFKASWGQSGNSGSSGNRYMDQLSTNRIMYYFFDGAGGPIPSQGLAKTTLIDTGLKWETGEDYNITLEMGFLKNKLTFNLEYWQRDAKDLLLNRSVRPSTGYTRIYTNAGHIQNKGYDLQVTVQNRSRNWNYNIKLNAGILENKAIDIGETLWSSDGVSGQDQWNNWSRTIDGHPISHWYGYRIDGVFQNQEEINAKNAEARAKGFNNYQGANVRPGDFIFRDLNGDGRVNADDREVLGHGFAKLNYGLNASFTYKNWDVNLFMYGVAGQKILSYAKRNLTNNVISGVGFRNILKSAYEEAWRSSNPNNEHSRLTNNDQNQNRRVSEYYIHSGDFLRMQNVAIGYSIPRELIRPLRIDNVRLNVGVENLFTATKYKFGDPEIGGNSIMQQGLDTGGYPRSRNFTFGISVGF